MTSEWKETEAGLLNAPDMPSGDGMLNAATRELSVEGWLMHAVDREDWVLEGA